MFLSAYPYSFDPVDTGTAVDSFMVSDVVNGDSAFLYLRTTRPFADTRSQDILWGNRIMYLNASYTFELARGVTYRPFGLLLQGVYLTAFAEGAALWNSDFLDFSLGELLGLAGETSIFRLGHNYLKDAGLRVEVPFVLFENWRAFFSFQWARRMSLGEKILRIERSGNETYIYRLDKNRYSFSLSLSN
jgi:hypothetical protein